MLDELLEDAAERMAYAVQHTQSEFATLRTDRASGAVLSRVMVDYYGEKVALLELARTATHENLLVVVPHDSNDLVAIERAIRLSGLDLNPASDGKVIRLVFPPLTEERRRQLVKMARSMAEEGRVAIRHIRRSTRSDLGELSESEDEVWRSEKKLQQQTDRHIAMTDELLANKERELLKI